VKGASCARLYVEGQCNVAALGVCWKLPSSCPPDDGTRYASCEPNAPDCVDACAAIRTEKPHALLASGSCP
jgi:hypothetical protein